MSPALVLWIIVACFMIVMLAVGTATSVWLWRRKRSAGRAPVSENLLRPPGESLRLKVDELSESVAIIFAAIIALPALVMATVMISSPDGSMSAARAWVAVALCLAILLPGVWLLFDRARNLAYYRQGFHGERATGEDLNQLMLKGCRVFHDVPMNPNGNIDHVIVSPAGVFAVETKARRKHAAPKGKRDCDAIFDGEEVEFPTWREVKMVKQAKRQAKHLRDFLSSAVGESVAVLPILTLPGWFVTTSVPCKDIRVLNPGQIASVVTDARNRKLTPEMMQRIAHQLDQKCRTVEM